MKSPNNLPRGFSVLLQRKRKTSSRHVRFFLHQIEPQHPYIAGGCVVLVSAVFLPRLACLRVALFMARPFLTRGVLHTLETLWCHLFTYLLLGTRFFNTFFVGEIRLTRVCRVGFDVLAGACFGRDQKSSQSKIAFKETRYLS